MGGTHEQHKEKHIFLLEVLKGGGNLEDLRIDGRIILKWM
jgi:hypothetical protein